MHPEREDAFGRLPELRAFAFVERNHEPPTKAHPRLVGKREKSTAASPAGYGKS
jgi:hypothetical protein